MFVENFILHSSKIKYEINLYKMRSLLYSNGSKDCVAKVPKKRNFETRNQNLATYGSNWFYFRDKLLIAILLK